MRKWIKCLSLTLCCFMMVAIFCACNDENSVKVSKISASIEQTTLYIGNNTFGSKEFSISYSPANATETSVEFFSYNTKIIDITKKEGTTDTFVVTAKEIEGDTAQTTVGVRMKGNVNVQDSFVVKLQKAQESLSVPSNVHYDENAKRLVWDNISESSFNEYVVKITDEQNVSTLTSCPLNYFSDFEKGKQLKVQVMAKGQIADLNSSYSDTYSFKVSKDIENFSQENGIISWSSVDGIDGYVLKINTNTYQIEKNVTQYVTSNEFDIARTYNLSLTTKIDDIIVDGQVTCECFNSNIVKLIVTKFSEPRIYLQDGLIVWDDVSNGGFVPENYAIYKDGEKIANVKSNYYNPVDADAGVHTYSVQAIGNGITTINSAIPTPRNISKLTSPTNVRVENGLLCWDKNNSATTYAIKVSGYVNGDYVENFESSLLQYSENASGIYMPLSTLFDGGDYSIDIYSVGDSSNYLNSELTHFEFSKLFAPTNFYIENDILKWDSDDNAVGYKIIMTNSEGTDSTRNISTNSFAIPNDIGIGNITFKVMAFGDDYLSSNYSNASKFLILESPNFKLTDGVLYWNTVNNSSSTTLKINSTEIPMQKEVKYDFINYASGSYTISIKSIGGNANSPYVGSVSSQYSQTYTVTKLVTPSLFVENGELKINGVENASGYITQNESKSNGSIDYTVYAKGSTNSGLEISNTNYYIRSSSSAPLNVWKLPSVTNINVDNGVVNWDPLNFYTYDSGKLFEGAKFYMTIIQFIDGVLQENVILNTDNLGTNNSVNFNVDSYSYGKYVVRVKIIGTSGNSGNKLYLSSEESTITFYKLKRPEIYISDIQNYLSFISESNLSGIIKWDKITIDDNVTATGYLLNIYNNSNTFIRTIDVKNSTQYRLSSAFPSGTYKISICAYGNEKNVINSNFTEYEESSYSKLNTAKNVSINNQGLITWETDYNTDGEVAGMPVNLRVVFGIVIDGVYYNPYDDYTNDFMNNLSAINSVRSYQIGDTFTAGTHKVKIVTLPLNYQVETGVSIYPVWGYKTDLIAEDTGEITFTKLESPLGLKMANSNDDYTGETGEYIINWNANSNPNVSRYELKIYNGYKVNSDGSYLLDEENATLITINQENSKHQYTYNFSQYLTDNNYSAGSYLFSISCLSNNTNCIASNKSILTANVLGFGDLVVKDGKLSWTSVIGATGYKFYISINSGSEFDITIDNGDTTTYELSLENDERFVAGEYHVKVRTLGNSLSNYNSQVFLSSNQKIINNYNADTNTLHSFEYVKLNTLTNLNVENGKIEFSDSNSNIDYYNLLVYSVSSGSTNYLDTLKISSKSFEFADFVDHNFVAGSYSFIIQAMGGETYINSEKSNPINPNTVYKLDIPNLRIEGGKIQWNPVENSSGYLINVSGAIYIISGTTKFDISKTVTDINGNSHSYVGGQYSFKIKSIGTNETYLNSDYGSTNVINKLGEVTGVSIKDGKLTWFADQTVANSLYIYIKREDSGAESKYSIINITDANIKSYQLNASFLEGNYLIYLQLIGDTGIAQDTPILGGYYLNGNPTIVYTFCKLQATQETSIEYTNDENGFGTYRFTRLDGEYSFINYEVNVNIKNSTLNYDYVEVIDDGSGSWIIPKSFVINGETVNIESGTTFTIKVKSLGGITYFDSNLNDSAYDKKFTIPNTPVIMVVENSENYFTGKITWEEIELATSYYVCYKFYPASLMAENGYTKESLANDESLWNEISVVDVKTTNLFLYITNKGCYKFSIYSLIEGSGLDVTTIKSPTSHYTSVYEYSLFTSGTGKIDDPFIVNNAQTFNYISYNLSAYYELSCDIDFSGCSISQIGSLSEMFQGGFNGKNFSLFNITITTSNEFNSLFDYVGLNGIIQNVRVYNIRITSGRKYIGGIAGYNEGTIKNCIVGATYTDGNNSYDGLSTISVTSSITTNLNIGGICAYNKGLINSCINYMIINPRSDSALVYCGGISAINYGTIEYCGNRNTVGGIVVDNVITTYANYSGGICGYNIGNVEGCIGKISSCYNIGNVFVNARNSNTKSDAYCGGICGRNDNGMVEYCYNDNSNRSYNDIENLASQTKIYATISNSTLSLYVGGLIGYNETYSKVYNCYSCTNIDYNTNNAIPKKTCIGLLIGQNNAATTSSSLCNLYTLSLNDITSVGTGIIMSASSSSNINLYLINNTNDAENFVSNIKSQFSDVAVWKELNNMVILKWE